MMGSVWEDHLPAIAMVLVQCVSAITALINRAALLKGMSPMVLIVYRQGIAAAVTFPVAYFARRGKSSTTSMGTRSFLLIFVTAFIGIALNQYIYYEGLYLASSSMASATSNLVPAVTFVFAAIIGMEQVHIKSLGSIAKILGTIFCVGGAISMALLRGPKLLNAQLPSAHSLLFKSLAGQDQGWLLGCLLLFASMCCWSLWLILQVPVTACYPDHLYLSAWLCFLSMLQVGVVAFLVEHDLNVWKLSSILELTCCLVSGIFGSGIQFFIQSWCISRKGPFFSAMFNPLSTVITTVLACIFLREELYVGSLLGAAAVIIGLYIVLWGKAKEKQRKSSEYVKPEHSANKMEQENAKCKIDLEQPLLIDSSNSANDDARK